jgi:hypothetical protein
MIVVLWWGEILIYFGLHCPARGLEYMCYKSSFVVMDL